MAKRFEPAYIAAHREGRLREIAKSALEDLVKCRICPRMCGVDRTAGVTGTCGLGRHVRISSYAPHFGEESPLVGRHGSGTIFVTSCNLKCLFCQNYDISHLGAGAEASPDKFAEMMLQLQQMGCHNINFVTPSHVVPQILEALVLAVEGGLSVPLVYNTGGYDEVETLRWLDGIFDIYMPDIKFFERDTAKSLANAPDYPDAVQAAVREMHRQVGDLELDGHGLATRGLLVRHLVMPGGLADTREVMRFLSGISKNTYVNIMDQYHPCYRAEEIPPLGRRITSREYEEALEAARSEGIVRLDNRQRRVLFRFT